LLDAAEEVAHGGVDGGLLLLVAVDGEFVVVAVVGGDPEGIVGRLLPDVIGKMESYVLPGGERRKSSPMPAAPAVFETMVNVISCEWHRSLGGRFLLWRLEQFQTLFGSGLNRRIRAF
jgi:hypothetical protein